MLTILEALKGINPYPLSAATLNTVAAVRGLTLTAEATTAALNTSAYRLAKADVLIALSEAPDITQGGISYSFTDEQRKDFRDEANAIYDELGDERPKTKYGYKGSRL